MPHGGVTCSRDDFSYDDDDGATLGSGAFGTVYRGYFRHEKAAIKVINVDARNMADKDIFNEVNVIK